MAHNSKAEVMKALMRNPNTARRFKKALQSPIGSTSRAQSQKVFSIMSKLQGSQDGQGGPGMMMERYEQSPDTSFSYNDDPKPMVMFHKLPDFYVNYDGVPRPEKASKNDGAGGPGVMDGEGGVGDWLSGALNSFEDAAGGAVANTIIPGYSALSSFAGIGSTPAPAPTNFPTNGPTGTRTDVPIDAMLANPTMINTNSSSPSVQGGAPTLNAPIQNPSPLSQTAGAISSGFKTLPKIGAGACATLGASTLAAGQYLGQNTLAAAARFGLPSSTDPQTGQTTYQGPNFTTLGNTAGSQYLADQYNQRFGQPAVPTAPTSVKPSIPFQNLTMQPQGQAFNPTPTMSTQYPSLGGTPLGNNQGSVSGINSLGGSDSSGASGAGSAALNYAKTLGVDPTTPLANIINTQGMAAIVAAIKQNEGSSPAGVLNNPGNIKYAGLPGQKDSGVKATDGGSFASYDTPEAGDKAIADIVSNAASGGSSAYGANPTLQSFANKYTNTAPGSGGGSSSGGGGGTVSGTTGGGSGTGYGNVEQAVKNATGPTMFALQTEQDPTNPVTGGKSLAQAEAANKSSIWSSFNIDSLSKQVNELQNVQSVLPKDMTDFIRDQDQYLNQTDQMINDYIEKNKNNNNPQDRAQIANHLNYLYTLRGAQNTRYINYMGSAIAENDSKLKAVTDTYTQNLKAATDLLTSTNAITKDMYDTYTKALTDMYDAVEKAPIAAQQYRLVEQQILTSHASQIRDAAANKSQTDYLNVYSKFKNQIYDSNDFALPIDLVSTLKEFAASNPDIDSGTILRIYQNTVNNALKAPSGTKDGNGSPIDKSKIAQQALTNYAKLAGEGVAEKNQNLMINAIGYGDQIATQVGASLGGSWTSQVTQIRSLISSLAAKGWFGGSSTPSKTSFINAAKSAGLDTGMASALYDQFKDYMGTPGANAADFVNAELNNTQSQTNRVPWTDQELTTHLGQMYAANLFTQSLSQSGLRRNPDGSVTITGAGSTTSL